MNQIESMLDLKDHIEREGEEKLLQAGVQHKKHAHP